MRVIEPRNAFMMESLLNEVTRSGTAARAQATLKRPDVYGKTGTTNDSLDAWFAGWQKNVVGVVWMGYDEPRKLGDRETGGGLALPVWIDYMTTMLKGVPVQEPTAPDGVVNLGGEWYYEEYAGGGGIANVGAGAPGGGCRSPACTVANRPAPIASSANLLIVVSISYLVFRFASLRSKTAVPRHRDLTVVRTGLSWRGIESRVLQDPPDSRGGHGMAESDQLALDPSVAPAGILAGHPQHESSDRRCGGWSAWSSVRVGPAAGDEVGVPAQQRSG
jgi:hypothetical protein